MSRKTRSEGALGRDPFESLQWEPEPEQGEETERVMGRDPLAGLTWPAETPETAPVQEAEPAPRAAPGPPEVEGEAEQPAPSPAPARVEPEELPAPPSAIPVRDVAEAAPLLPQATPPEVEARVSDDVAPASVEPPPTATPKATQEIRPAPAPVFKLELDEEELDARLRAAETIEPEFQLRGKGVWLLYSGDVDVAIEMALAIGATHVFYKTGQQGMFFVDTARRVHDRVREAGLVPFACIQIYGDDPLAEAQVVVKSVETGYRGIVFEVGDEARGKGLAVKALGWRLLEADLNPTRLYYTSFPDIRQHLDVPYRDMNRFCRGGFMPQCYPAFGRMPDVVIDRWAYGEHVRWSASWGNMPPIYPVLAAYQDEEGNQRLDGRQFMAWAETLDAHRPSFFSVYRAGTTDRELWPILAAMSEKVAAPTPPRPRPPAHTRPAAPAPRPSAERAGAPAPTEAAPPTDAEPHDADSSAVYHEVTVNDSVWGICRQYGIPKEQFWAWNGHLWDEVGMPRDDLYLQERWRVRVA